MGRATATVLFTDLVGSTELRGRLGEEAAEELRRRHDRLLAEAVERHNGQVVKGLGDGIMATFSGAADAVAAAVAIQQAVDRLSRSGKAPMPLAVRVGLSAGDVTVEEDDVHGTPVIEAARLCAAVGGGEILAAEVVRVLAGSTAQQGYVSVGPLELKGLDHPVAAVRVDWEPAVVSSIPMPQLFTDVGRIFVGRDAELERLGQLWKEAAAGERRVALLAGEPGVGKTRLAAELATRVHEEGGVVLAGRCDEDLGVPYQPFVEALRHFVDHAAAADLKDRLGRYGGELTRLVPELPEQVPDLHSPLQSDPETERYRLFDAVGAWLTAASVEEPLLLVLDDLQWAARPTLLLLRHVVRSPHGGRLLVVGTYRDTELGRGHPLVELLADLRRDGHGERLSLVGLDQSQVALWVHAITALPLEGKAMPLARAIYQETEGNPFFVREVLRHLIESGTVSREDPAGVHGLAEAKIPEGVREVIGQRLSRLTERANDVLRCAAVVGLEFEVDVVQQASGLEEQVLLSGLEEAVAARLVVEVPGTTIGYRFAHSLVRSTLYEELSSARRVTLHRRVGEALEVIYDGRLEDHLPALARHFREAVASAGNSKAVEYARAAGEKAVAVLANDEAAAYFQQALEVLDMVGTAADDPARLAVLVDLGEAQRRAGDPVASQTLLSTARLAQRCGDVATLARAALANSRGVLSSAIGFLDYEQVAILEAALDAVPDEDSQLRARLLASLGLELIYAYMSAEVASTHHHRRLTLCDEALAMARRLGDDATLAHVLLARYYPIAAPDNLSQRLDETAELIAVTDRLGDPVLRARAWWFRFRAATEASDFETGRLALERFERLIEEASQPFLRWMATWNRGGQRLLAGRFADAEALFREAHTQGRAMGHRDADLFFAVQQFQLHYEQGRLSDTDERLLQTPTAPRGMLPALLARFHAELGDLEQARRLLDEVARAKFLQVPLDLFWLRILADSAAVSTRLGDTERARILYELLAPYAGQVVVILGIPSGSVAHYLGLLATSLGCHEDAEAHFVAAAAIAKRADAPIWLARTRLEWARLLLARRQPGDVERARELFQQALATARAFGLAKIERDAVALLQ
jgi:class 3 adenylate cyclase/tetratricopeptide (TPR) repeat protein